MLQKREVEYDKYQLDKLTDAKAEFRILLRETKLITYKSRDLVNESERHYKDIITVLKVCKCALGTCSHQCLSLTPERPAILGFGLHGRGAACNAVGALGGYPPKGPPTSTHRKLSWRETKTLWTIFDLKLIVRLTSYGLT